MTETTVRTNLLQPLQIITKLRVNAVGQDLRVLAVNDVPLPVQEPKRNLELGGVLDDGDETLKLIGVELTGTANAKGKQRDQEHQLGLAHRLLRSTSAFLQTMLA